MIVSVPFAYRTTGMARRDSPEKAVVLHSRTSYDIPVLGPEEAPVATQWVDVRLSRDGRPVETRFHDGRHWRRLHTEMFGGMHAMSPAATIQDTLKKLERGFHDFGPMKAVADPALRQYRDGKTRTFQDVRNRYHSIDPHPETVARITYDKALASLAIIGDEVWYACSEPVHIVIPSSFTGSGPLILTTTSDDPMHDVMIYHGFARYRADRLEDAVMALDDYGPELETMIEKIAFVVVLPDTIAFDDEKRDMMLVADRTIAMVGREQASGIHPDLLHGLADLISARRRESEEQVVAALRGILEVLDDERLATSIAAALNRWNFRPISIDAGFEGPSA